MIPHRVVAAAACLVLVATATYGQTPAPKLYPTVKTLCGTDTISIDEIAGILKPVLWFSRTEPLIGMNTTFPSAWPTRDGKPRPDSTTVMYYRIVGIKENGSAVKVVDGSSYGLRRAMTRAEKSEGQPQVFKGFLGIHALDPVQAADKQWSVKELQGLDHIMLRYLFYYPFELGTENHRHDLESVEVRVAARTPAQAEGKACVVVLATHVYGSAHGVGLYTNELDLDKAMAEGGRDATGFALDDAARKSVRKAAGVDDQLIVLVEEGKHASAPDRDGDGYYSPGFDVNKQSNDAWGIRDSIRSSVLTPQFQSEMFKPRVADQDGVDLKVTVQELRLSARDTVVCGPIAPAGTNAQDHRRAALDTYAAALKNTKNEVTGEKEKSNPGGLLRGKGFCDNVPFYNSWNGKDLGSAVGFGGTYNGFTHWYERISASLRWDGSFGWTATIPHAQAVPGIGGWLVARASGPWPGYSSRKSWDVLYVPSADRFADWYVAGGIDRGTYVSGARLKDNPGVVNPEVPAAFTSQCATFLCETGVRSAFETGLKFRVRPLLDSLFLGARVGIRVNGTDPMRNPRLVFEVGGGIW